MFETLKMTKDMILGPLCGNQLNRPLAMRIQVATVTYGN